MKNNLVELVFVLDRSGSMSGLEEQTISSYNDMIEKQKKEEGEALVTTVLFDDQFEQFAYRTPLSETKPLTYKEYYPRGWTALYDAIGSTIDRISFEQENPEKSVKPNKTIFAIITDGLENASSKFDSKMIRSMIANRQKEHAWEFLFLGANFDVYEFTDHIGIPKERAVRYATSKAGTKVNFDTLVNFCIDIRSGKEFSKEWKKDIEEMYKKEEEK
jgi:uncharacterized protein YegL